MYTFPGEGEKRVEMAITLSLSKYVYIISMLENQAHA